MVKLISLFGSPSSQGANQGLDIFRKTPAPAQRMVKDEVVFAPSADPYSALSEAGKRLLAGQSIFHIATLQSATKQTTKGSEENVERLVSAI
jgi:hypothetical protein